MHIKFYRILKINIYKNVENSAATAENCI